MSLLRSQPTAYVIELSPQRAPPTALFGNKLTTWATEQNNQECVQSHQIHCRFRAVPEKSRTAFTRNGANRCCSKCV